MDDFGTTGLTGRTDDPSDTGHFPRILLPSFELSQGRKGGWALGIRQVFARMSAWSCWFGLTTRDDGTTLLMGKAAIGPRQVGGKRYPAFAPWAVVDDELERPIEDQQICGGSETASVFSEGKERQGCRSSFHGREAVRMSRTSGAAY